MSISFKLDAFDGPLDLLLHLIEKNKIDIFDIPIASITQQYFEYVADIKTANADDMSEFMFMAATLLNIKSRLLLPAPVNEDGEEEDPRAELVERLLEYKMFKYASYELKDKQEDAQRMLFKKATIPNEISDYEDDKVDVAELLSDVTLAKLQDIFYSVMQKQIDKIDPIRSKFGQIRKEPISVEDRIVYIEAFAISKKRFSFRQILEASDDKITVIVTFLGILELMKTGKLKCEQETLFSDIMLTYKENPDEERKEEKL